MATMSDDLMAQIFPAGRRGSYTVACGTNALEDVRGGWVPEAVTAQTRALQALLQRTIYGDTVEEFIVPAPLMQAIAPGSICEVCLDAPATGVIAAPWGGDMGICEACDVAPQPTEEEA